MERPLYRIIFTVADLTSLRDGTTREVTFSPRRRSTLMPWSIDTPTHWYQDHEEIAIRMLHLRCLEMNHLADTSRWRCSFQEGHWSHSQKFQSILNPDTNRQKSAQHSTILFFSKHTFRSRASKTPWHTQIIRATWFFHIAHVTFSSHSINRTASWFWALGSSVWIVISIV